MCNSLPKLYERKEYNYKITKEADVTVRSIPRETCFSETGQKVEVPSFRGGKKSG